MSAPDAGLRMPILSHLAELRRRLLWSALVLVAATFACFAFAEPLFHWLYAPMAKASSQPLVVLSPLEMFFAYMKLALVGGLFVSTPWLLLQAWLFIAPGLYAHEKRWIAPFVVLGTAFFVAGGAFAYFAVLPTMLKYLTLMLPAEVQASYSVGVYVGLVLNLLVIFGIIFELPLVMWVLSAAGVVSPDAFARFRKYWLVLAFVIGGIVSADPSPITQALIAGPLLLFWELGIIGGRVLARRRANTTATAQA